MKKNFFILLSVFVFSLAIFGGLFVSCDLEVDVPDNEKGNIQVAEAVPAVSTVKDGIIIAITNYSDVSYVNIYRQEVADPKNPSASDLPINNIGILYTDYYSEDAWIYQDYYVHNNKNYRYCVKYLIKGVAYKSKWSDVITASSPYSYEIDSFKYTISEKTYFAYDSDSCILTLKEGSLDTSAIPNDILKEVKPKIVFSTANGTIKKAYPLQSTAQDEKLLLRNVLEDEFIDVDISIASIVFEKKIYVNNDSTNPIMCVIWGEPASRIPPIKTLDGSIELSTIKIAPTSSDPGQDYTDSGF